MKEGTTYFVTQGMFIHYVYRNVTCINGCQEAQWTPHLAVNGHMHFNVAFAIVVKNAENLEHSVAAPIDGTVGVTVPICRWHPQIGIKDKVAKGHFIHSCFSCTGSTPDPPPLSYPIDHAQIERKSHQEEHIQQIQPNVWF